MCLSKGDQGGFDEHDDQGGGDLDEHFLCRMEEEEFKEVYIVKLPNNFCGIGACVIDHPKKVKKLRYKQKFCCRTSITSSPFLDPSEEKDPHAHEEESCEGGPDNSPELHPEPSSDQRLQV